MAAQRARSESEQTGDRSQGWVRTDFLQNEINAFRYNPFGGVQNPQLTIDAITTSLVRRGHSQLKMYDAELSGDLFDMPAAPVRMAAGVEYREESVSDIPDDQFQRGLIFGTEAVAAAASRDNWAAFLELSIPILKSLGAVACRALRRLQRFRHVHQSEGGGTLGTDRKSGVACLVGHGFPRTIARAGGSRRRRRLRCSSRTTSAAPTTPCTARPTDYNLIFSGNRNLKPEESETLNVGVAWKPCSDIDVTLDYWDVKQEKKIDQVPFGFLYTQFCSVQASTVCIRGTPLAGDALGPLQFINTTFINIGEQTAKRYRSRRLRRPSISRAARCRSASRTRICWSSSAWS